MKAASSPCEVYQSPRSKTRTVSSSFAGRPRKKRIKPTSSSTYVNVSYAVQKVCRESGEPLIPVENPWCRAFRQIGYERTRELLKFTCYHSQNQKTRYLTGKDMIWHALHASAHPQWMSVLYQLSPGTDLLPKRGACTAACSARRVSLAT